MDVWSGSGSAPVRFLLSLVCSILELIVRSWFWERSDLPSDNYHLLISQLVSYTFLLLILPVIPPAFFPLGSQSQFPHHILIPIPCSPTNFHPISIHSHLCKVAVKIYQTETFTWHPPAALDSQAAK